MHRMLILLQDNDFVELFAGMGHVSGALRDEPRLCVLQSVYVVL